MIICTICENIKSADEFRKDRTHKNGLSSACKQCSNRAQQQKRAEDPERYKLYNRTWNYKNPEKLKTMLKTWAQENTTKKNAINSRSRANQIKATPEWLKVGDFRLMETRYELAKYMTECTGMKWTVDHIVPLQGVNVCGLHVPWNMRVIPGSENFSKSNKTKEMKK